MIYLVIVGVVLFGWFLTTLPLVTFELIGSIGMIYILYLGIRWQFAKAGVLWTFVPDNHAIPVDYGDGKFYKVLGIKKDPISHLAESLGLPTSGIVWMGLPGVKIHEFPLVHERANKEVDSETDHKKWMHRETEARTERYLLKEVVHWAFVPGVEFKGNQRADIFFQYQATVAGEKGVHTAVYKREGKFFDILNGMIESSFNSLKMLDQMDYDEFVADNKAQDSPMMDALKLEVNKTAVDNSGYKLDHIFIYRADASSKEEEELARLKKTAAIRKEAAKLEAQGDVADVTELIKLIKRALPKASHDLILQEVSKLGIAKRYANSDSLQAIGGGAVLGLGNNNNQKQNNKKRRN